MKDPREKAQQATIELMLKLERAKVDHLQTLVKNFQKTKTTGDMLKLFDYVEKLDE